MSGSWMCRQARPTGRGCRIVPSTAMVATTFAYGDQLYTAFGTDWHPHEHATGDPNIYRLDVRRREGLGDSRPFSR